ncbi:MAG: FecR domain-containing protein [Phenylobacterium sp.]|uniref:FecR family protein n=1 Tax=Phenylobacterium sp. TaxID=1871053 RepID=UPI001A460D37|nr:FecR domain-containing protein [Phenylobacterium sp.]MBL8772733.1 FecR domain-containing protein [Phenylobacterium sp.]
MSESADRGTQASQWFTVMTGGDIAPKELDAFRAWRRDPANAAAFERVKQGWEAAGGLAERPAIAAMTETALAKYPAKVGAGQAGPSRRFVLAPIGLGLASILVAAGAVFAWRNYEPTYSTQVGGQRLEVLADGSRVRLNTDTRVRVDFRDGERRVVLDRGQAFFDVAHDASRPFVVVADGVRVRALGTRFDVRNDGAVVRVTLVQGRVEVRGGDGERTELTPGQAVIADRRGVSRPSVANTSAVASWTTGRLTFSGVPLREAVAEVNRYSDRKVVLEAPEAVAGELVSGQFVAGDVDNFVAGARSLYGLRVTSETPREIRLSPG